ncbi:peptidoglycan/LPS O-acetylase OafA/YrhL [Glaciihabitans tibetensis]|uniref:Peptidoglycan/LPS O-acetylase OafA/YrhL n=1 Tax=Glaciihabitans tibetensis TaxID=1266600 RepID=A0A2T0VFF6_9MICO|nr:acyltransferase [Glaciihabitans tibetensis]PRY68933.1 peptidoglycan/LPS O-acetylase OafA/YrhL [Glaciihabitans tibetensis]
MGVLRLFLALSVVSAHAGSNVFGLPVIPAPIAVNFFFIISGFYMAMVLNEKYVDRSTLGAFYKNRVLRLFPVYVVGLVIALAVSLPAIVEFFAQLTAWAKIFFVAANALIAGQDLFYLLCLPTVQGGCADAVALAINPPAWSLAVELGFYLIAPFIVRSPRRTFLFVMVGAVYLLAISFLVYPTPDLGILPQQSQLTLGYYFYPSSFLFFGLGALAYQLSKGIAKPHWWAGVLLFVVLVPTTITMPVWQPLIFALAIPVLFTYTKHNRADRLIGELSYPVYILHFPILVGINAYASTHPRLIEILPVGTLVGVASVVLGLVLHFTIERAAKRFRAMPTTADTLGNADAPTVIDGDVAGTARSAVVRRVVAAVLLLSIVAVPLTTVGTAAVAQAARTNVPSRTPLYLTDDYWQAGVSRESAAFFVSRTKANLEQFEPGRTVTFDNGEHRRIVETETTDLFLQVIVSGQPLDGTIVGYPHEFSVGP